MKYDSENPISLRTLQNYAIYEHSASNSIHKNINIFVHVSSKKVDLVFTAIMTNFSISVVFRSKRIPWVLSYILEEYSLTQISIIL